MMSLEAKSFRDHFPYSHAKGMVTLSQKLDLLKQIAHGLAVQFGSSCEIVIHDLRKKELDSSIVYIENGHVSNRKLGDGPSSVVLETLSRKPSQIQDRLSYLTKTEDGRILKSSTMYIRDDDDSIAYIFSLNYDITSLLTVESAIHSFISTEQKKEQETDNNQPPKNHPQCKRAAGYPDRTGSCTRWQTGCYHE